MCIATYLACRVYIPLKLESYKNKMKEMGVTKELTTEISNEYRNKYMFLWSNQPLSIHSINKKLQLTKSFIGFLFCTPLHFFLNNQIYLHFKFLNYFLFIIISIIFICLIKLQKSIFLCVIGARSLVLHKIHSIAWDVGLLLRSAQIGILHLHLSRFCCPIFLFSYLEQLLFWCINFHQLNPVSHTCQKLASGFKG